MNDIKLSVMDVIKILNGPLPKHEKISLACQRFSCLDITHVQEHVKNSFGMHCYEMNSILKHYHSTIKTWEDYRFISDEDLNKMLKSIKKFCKNLNIS